MSSGESDLRCRIIVERMTGDETFKCQGNSGFTLRDFWQWAGSDLIGNTNRARLAEFIVARALGLGKDVQNEWGSCDLLMGTTRVEVKSSAYIQSWPQTTLYKPHFWISPHRAWDQATGKLGTEIRRHSDVYVFALLAHKKKSTINPLDSSQWEFYVVSTVTLNREYPMDEFPPQKCIPLNEVLRLCPTISSVSDIKEMVEKAARQS